MPITISNFDEKYDRDSRFDKAQFNEINKFQEGDIISFGPCDWIVLENIKNSGIGMISKSILFYVYLGTIPIGGTSFQGTITCKDIITMMNAQNFIDKLFNKQEQSMLYLSKTNTIKKLYLPDLVDIIKLQSLSEQLNNNFLISKSDIFEDLIKEEPEIFEPEKPQCGWWVDSPNADYTIINENGKEDTLKDGGVYGVRPVIYLKIS